jgi:hypothetical protein
MTSSRVCLVAFDSGDPQGIGLPDVCMILMWLASTRAYATLTVDGQATVHVGGSLRRGVIDHERREFRVRVGETTFTFPVDSFVSASIKPVSLEIVCGGAKLAMSTDWAGDAWRHVQISRRWAAEQPDNPSNPFGPGKLRRLN